MTEGRLSDRQTVTDACNRFWDGVVAWATEHGYQIVADQEIPF